MLIDLSAEEMRLIQILVIESASGGVDVRRAADHAPMELKEAIAIKMHYAIATYDPILPPILQ